MKKLPVVLLTLALLLTAPTVFQVSATTPSVTADVPAEVFLGEDFSVALTFDNTNTTDTGYGPFFDVVLDVNGADGAANTSLPLDGLSLTDVTYSGAALDASLVTTQTFPDTPLGTAPCGPAQSQVEHPFLIDSAGDPVVVCGTPGDQLITIELPFGSFTPDQPPATVELGLNVDAFADLGVPLDIQYRSGFRFGADPLQNPCCDPIIVDPPSPDSTVWPSNQVTPILIQGTKADNLPENEIATGPNNPGTWTISVDIADGQTITDFDITDLLPNNIVVNSITPSAGTVVSPTVFPAGPANNFEWTVNVPSVTGTTAADDITVEFEFYVPRLDADGNEIIPAVNGDDTISVNQFQAIGDWNPLDPRDAGGTDNAAVGPCPNCPDDDVIPKSIAIQKSASADVVVPGDIVTYTYDVQISDFFAFDGIVVDDTLSDGQRWTGAAPTLSVSSSSDNFTGTIGAANYTFTVDSPGTGNTNIQFRISDELITQGLSGDVLGGCVPVGGTGGPAPDCATSNNGLTTLSVSYDVEIQEDYSDNFPSGDPSVDQGDTLDNTLTINGNVLNTDDLTDTGNDEADVSEAGLIVESGTVSKSIYAINGSTTLPSPLEVLPGDTLTYRVQYNLPTTDFEDLVLSDYPPLPVLDATEITTFNAGIAGSVPPTGTATYGPADTFYTYTGSSIIPGITSNATDNVVNFAFGDFDDPASVSTTIDLLFTFTIGNDPFADGLFLTNQVLATEGTTQGESSSSDSIVQIQLREPALLVSKGVTGTDNTGATFQPDDDDPTPPLTSADLDANPIDSDLTGADGGDLVEFTITIENEGGAAAFDIAVSDVLPAGFIIPGGGINLTAVRGDGTAVTFTPIGPNNNEIDIFRNNDAGLGLGQGIRLDDPEETNPGAGGICQSAEAAPGTNIILITYSLQIDPNIEAPATITNLAQIDDYSNSEGGPDFIEDGSEPNDDAQVEVFEPEIAKSIVTTSEAGSTGANTLIGEIVRYRLEATVPEAGYTALDVADDLPDGLQYLDDGTAAYAFVSDNGAAFTSTTQTVPGCVAADPVGGVTPTCAFAAGTVTQAGGDVTFSFGDVTNTDNDADAEFIVVEFNALVENIIGNQDGTALENTASLQAGGTDRATSDPVTVDVTEPDVTFDSKTQSASTGDAGDTITYTVTFTNNGTAPAYNLTVTDTLPAQVTFTSGFTTAAGVAPTTSGQAAGVITLTYDVLAVGESSAVSFDVTVNNNVEPTESFFNTAALNFTSLPGGQGTIGNPTGSDTPGASGTADGERTGDDGPGGPLNDYTDTVDSPAFTVDTPQVVKTVDLTSSTEADTGDDAFNGALLDLTIGEEFEYVITITFPEGISRDVYLLDDAEPVIAQNQAVELLSATVESVGANLSGTLPAVSSTFPLQDQNTDTTADGFDTTGQWRGDVTNTPDGVENAADQIVIRVRARMDDRADNVAGDNVRNRARLVYDDIDDNEQQDNSAVSVEVAEPNLTLDKSVTAVSNPSATITGGDADGAEIGDTVTFTLTIENTGTAPAYEVALTDELPNAAGTNFLTFDTLDTAASTCDDRAGYTATPGTPTSTFSFDNLLTGETCTLVFTTTVTADVLANETYVNDASIDTYSSRPGTTAEDDRIYDPVEEDASVTIDLTIPVKSIDGTSESFTSDAEDGGPGNARPVAIGEVVTFRLSTTLPEAQTRSLQLVDVLAEGIDYVPSSARVSYIATGNNITFPGLGAVANETEPTTAITPTFDAGTRALTFDIGNVVNNDADADDEFLIIEFDVVVVNDNVIGDTNGNGVNDVGDLWSNAFEVFTEDQSGTPISRGTSEPVSVIVVESEIAITKTINQTLSNPSGTTVFTPGDTVVYDVGLINNGNADSFEINIIDIVDANLNLDSVTPIGAPGYIVTTDNTTLGNPGTADVILSELRVGDTVTVRLTTTVLNTVTVGQVIANQVDGTYTSLPGDGTDTPGASGDTDGERNGSGGVNDYTDSSTADLTVGGSYELEKSITATSETSTDNASLPNTGASNVPLAVGEVLRYRLATTVAEGVTNDLSLTDQFSAGVRPILDDTTELTLVSDSGLDLTGFPAVPEDATAFDLFDAGGTAQVPGLVNYNDVTNFIEFALGDVINRDADNASAELVIIEFNVVVVNTSGTNLGNIFANNYDATYNDGDNNLVTIPTSNTVSIIIVEPVVAADKQINETLSNPAGTTTFQAGDTVVYDVVLNNSGDADAFEIDVVDVVDANLTLDSVSLENNPGYVTIAENDNILGNPGTADVTLNRLEAGDSVTVRLTTTVLNTVTAGQIIQNEVNGTYTSLPGDGTSGNPTGSDTPGASGEDDGERNGEDGTGGPDDYVFTDTVPFDVNSTFELTKGVAPATATIGDTVTYTLTLELIEGITTNVSITDTFPAGYEYVAGSLTVTPTSGTTGYTAASEAFAAPDLTIPLGTVNIPSDGDDTNNTVVLTYEALVLNTADNNDGDTDTNSATASGDDVTDSTDTSDVAIVEPDIDVTKTLIGAQTSPVEAGTLVDYELTVANTGNTTGYDILLTDTLATDTGTDLMVFSSTGAITCISTVNDANTAGDNPITYTIDSLPVGETCTIPYTAEITNAVATGRTLDNTVTGRLDSQDADGAPQEREDTDTDSATISTTGEAGIEKTVNPTLAGNSAFDATVPDVLIGETITYTLTLGNVPQGTNTLLVTDELPSLFQAEAARVISLDGITPSNDPPIITLSDSNADTIDDTVTFDFGTITNPADADIEQIVLEIDATLLDSPMNSGGDTETNTAIVTYNGVDTSDTALIEIVEPAPTITKTFTPDQLTRGSTTQMTLVIENTGSGPMYDAQITDVLDGFLRFDAIAYDTTAATQIADTDMQLVSGTVGDFGQSLDIRVGNDAPLLAGETLTITIDLFIDDTATVPVTIDNTANLTTDSTPTDDNPDERDYPEDSTDQLEVVAPALVISKVDSADPVQPLEVFEYTITVENTGSPAVDATNVTTQDTLPPGFNVLLVTPSQGTCSPISGGVLTCGLGTLTSGSTANIVIRGRFAAGTAAGTVVNTVTVDSTEQDTPTTTTPDDGDDEGTSEETTIGTALDLAITKTVNDSTPNPNDLITFTLDVVNNGPSPATNVVVEDTIPAGLTFSAFVPSSLPCVYAAPTLTCTFPTLGVGATRTIGIEANVDSGTTGTTIDNTATVTSDETDSDDTNNSDDATVTVDGVDLAVVKTVDNATPAEGGTIVYTVALTNNGPGNATNIIVTDVLPAGVTYVSDDSTNNPTDYDPASGEWTINFLQPANTLQLLITATVDTGTAGTQITNTATRTSNTEGDSDPTNDTDDAVIAIDGLDLSVTKSVNENTPSAGQNITYSVTVTNNGPGQATGIRIEDDFAALPDVTYVSDNAATLTNDASANTIYNPSTGIWGVGTLDAGNSLTLQIVARVEPGASGQTITNTAALESSDQPDSNPNNNTDDAIITVNSVDLAVVKTVDNANPSPNDTVAFTIALTNNGPGDATNIVVTDALPAGLTYVSDNTASTGTTYVPATGEWTVPALADAESLNLVLTATVDAAASGQITNTATITGLDQNDSNPNNNTDEATVNISGVDLSIEKTVDNPSPAEGDTVIYSLTVANNSTNTATGVQVTDDLNTLAVTYVSDNSATLTDDTATPTSYDSGTGIWSIGTLNGGTSLTLTITATVDAGAAGSTITNTATVSGNEPESDTTNNTDDATIGVNVLDLSVEKIVDNPTPNTGEDVTYTITVTNNGPANATNVVLEEDLPLDNVSLTFVSAIPSQGTFTPNNPPPSVWQVGDLASGDTAVLILTVTVNISEGEIVNTATITGLDQTDSDPDNNTDDATIAVGGLDLSVEKTVDDPNPANGDTVVYSVAVTNNGPAQATNVLVVDILPAGVDYVSDDSATLTDDASAATSYDPATGDWTVGTLDAGTTLTLNITVTVTADGGAVVNTADASSDQTDIDTDNNTDDATIGIGGADLRLNKTRTVSGQEVGDLVQYEITVTNDGPAAAFGVAVRDDFPAALSFETADASQGTYDETTSIWTIGTLNLDQSVTLTLTGRVTDADGSQVNTAQIVSSDQPDPDSTPDNDEPGEDDQDTSDSSVIFDPPYGVKTFNEEGLPELEWTMVWVNPGTVPVDATITDPLRAGTTYVPGSLTCFSPGLLDTIECEYDEGTNSVNWRGTVYPSPGVTPDQDIDNAANRLIIRFRVTVPDSADEVLNRATLSTATDGTEITSQEEWERDPVPTPEPTDEPDTDGSGDDDDDDDDNDDDNQAVVPGPSPSGPVITKQGSPALIAPGETVTWTIVVTNTDGNQALDNIVFTDLLPGEVEVLDVITPNGVTADARSDAITFTVNQLQAQQSTSVQIVTTSPSSGEIPPFLVNLARLEQPFSGQAEATVAIVGELPATGETSPWRGPLLSALAAVALAAVFTAWRRLRTSP